MYKDEYRAQVGDDEANTEQEQEVAGVCVWGGRGGCMVIKY